MPAASYAVKADLIDYSMPAAALVDVPDARIARVLFGKSRFVDTYIPAQYGGIDPDNVPPEITEAVCHLAAPDLLIGTGVDPDDPTLVLYVNRATQTRAWLRDLASGKASLTVDDITPDTEEGGPAVLYPDAIMGASISEPIDPRRGW